MVKYLVVEQQMDLLCEDEYGHTPLHRACTSGGQAVVEFLTSELQSYAPIPKLMSDLKNSTAAKGHLDITRFFISVRSVTQPFPVSMV